MLLVVAFTEGVDPELALAHRQEQLILEVDREANVLAKIAYPRRRYFGKEEALYGFPSSTPGKVTEHPAIVASKYGRGRVVYIPSQIDLLNALWGVPEYDEILSNAVEWASGMKKIITTSAPSTMELVVQTQNEKGRTLLHLVNFTSPPMWTGINPMLTSNMINEIIALSNITVKMRNTKDIKSVFAVNANKKLKFRSNGEYITFSVPKVYIHEVVSIE